MAAAKSLVDVLSKPIDFQCAAEWKCDKAGQRKNLDETVLIDQINKSKLTQLKLMDEKPSLVMEKDPHDGVLMEQCGCENCLKYRESVIHFYVEECEYNILWFRLQQIIEKHYEIIEDNSICLKKYRELMCPTRTKWLSDGQADNKKNIQISLASNLPLNNDMTLILIFNMLHSRDPHQLFELLCMQVKAISVAYFENLRDMCQPDGGMGQKILGDLNSFVSHGASAIQVGALKLEPLMAEYLKQFKLSWVFVCEHIYHRWVTTEVITLLLMNPMETHSFYSVDFEESVTEWCYSWALLERFHSSAAEVARRKRIFEGQRLLQKIKGTHLDKSELVLDDEVTKENDWRGILIHIRTLWQECARTKELDPKMNVCRTCDSPIQVLRHAWDCNCRTCAVVGGLFPYLGGWELQSNLTECTRCYRALQLATSKAVTGAVVEKKDFTYHLGWAVFKHLPCRLEYIVPELDLSHLCVFPPQRCSHTECLVAQSVILGHYPKEVAEYLVENFQPVDETLRYQIQPQTSVKNLFVILAEERQLNMVALISLLAEVNVQRTVPDKKVFGELLNKYLRATGKDLELDLSAYPENDRSDFMGNGESFPVGLVDVICRLVNPVNQRGVNDLQAQLREKHASSIDLIAGMLLRYRWYSQICRYFVEKDIKSGGSRKSSACRSRKGKGDAHGHSHQHSHGHSHGHHHHQHEHDEHSECCSMFGHGEWQRSRSNETRERLRKKLQMQLQLFAQQHQNGAQQDATLVAAGQALAASISNGGKGKSKKAADKNENGHRGFYKTLENVLMNLPHRSRELPELDQLNLRDMLHRAGGDYPRDPYSPPATPTTPDSISEELLRVQCKVEELQERFGNISLDAMVDYIEGNRGKPKVCDASNADKKAAKKLKQKQKKQEQKRTEELQELKVEYHAQFAEEAQLKNKLKSLKAAKKKDKKKISDVETELKKASRVASKTESTICEIICELREFNPEFKFSYQPPKEQKPKVEVAAAKPPEPVASQKLPPAISIPPMISSSIPMNFINGNENAFSQFVAMQRQGVPQFKAPMPMMSATTMTTSGGGDCDDPSKRMVTIRRVNLPHAEPQVAVMAKGESPDQDRLLYSFINGQMVPASSLVPSVVKSLQQTAIGMNQPKVQPAANQNAKGAPATTANKNNKKTKTEEKKKPAEEVKPKKGENRKEVKQEPANNKNDVKQEPANFKNNNKKTAPVAIKETVPEKLPAKAGKEKGGKAEEKNTKAAAAPPPPLPPVPAKLSKTAKKAAKAEAKLKKAQKKATTPVPVPVEPEPVVVVKPKKVKREPRVEYLDPSFNRNKFDLLCLNDDDDEDVGHSESEEEEESEEEVEVPPKIAQPPPQPVEQPPTKGKSNSNNDKVTKNDSGKASNKKQTATATTANNKKDKKNAQPPVAQKSDPVTSVPAPPAAPLSKKERKRLARLQKQDEQQQCPGDTEEPDPVEKAVKRAEKMAESLTTEMNKLNLNADTTIELINPFMKPPQPNPFLTNPHITEQLNRGINVGGLQLPPGITLTKLDPARAKEIQRKKEAIGKVSQPVVQQNRQQQQQQQERELANAQPQVIMANPVMNGKYATSNTMTSHRNGQFVVIENPELAKRNENVAGPAQTGGKNKSKKDGKAGKQQVVAPPPVVENGKRNGKNDGGKNKENQRQQIQQKILQSRKEKAQAAAAAAGNKGNTKGTSKNAPNAQNGIDMVTLRNPMFHPPPPVPMSGAGPMANAAGANHQNPIRLRSTATGQVMDTPAAIIQNENGMFTIRNPALHQAYTNSMGVGVGGGGGGMGGLVGGSMYQTEGPPQPPMPQPVQEITIDTMQQAWKVPSSVTATPIGGGGAVGNTKAAIGSEMKQRQEPWQPDMSYPKMGYHVSAAEQQQQRSYSPFDSQLNLGTAAYNGHSPIVGQRTVSGGHVQSQSVGGGSNVQGANAVGGGPDYLAKAGFSAFVSADHGCGGGHGSGGDSMHQCEDPHPSSLVGDQKYFREPPMMNMMQQNAYSDFLQNLQPGQRLNSEVTIHNINESISFLANQQQSPNRVEITRIPMEKSKHCDKLAVGSERRSQQQQQHQMGSRTDGNIGNGGHSFPHQQQQQQQQQHHHDHLGLGGSSDVKNVFEPNPQFNLNELASDDHFNYYFDPPKKLKLQDIYNTGTAQKQDGPE